MSLTIDVREVQGVSILDLSGRLTLGESASALREKLRGLAAGAGRNILLNLQGVSYVDSSGIGVLVSGYATVTNSGGQLKLLNLTSRVKDVLVVTKLYTVFDVFNDEAAAVGSFNEASAAAGRA